MSGFRHIIGNEKSLNYFNVASKQGKLSHAYIICGQKGSGKKTFAESVSAGLLCEKNKMPPCQSCASCIKAATGNHPDIIRLVQEKPDVIKIDEIREQITDDISIKPFYGPYKIYIINDAHLMNVNAQNALLKTLEEPPGYGVIFLLTDNPDGLLETVRSRCLKIDMEALSDEDMQNSLSLKGFSDEKEIKAALAYANGNLGLAEELCDKKNEAEVFKMAELLTGIKDFDAYKIYETIGKYDKKEAKKALDIIATWFRDVLTLKATQQEEGLFFPGYLKDIKTQASKISYEGLEQIFGKIKTTLEEINSNVKTEAAMETLFITIREQLR